MKKLLSLLLCCIGLTAEAATVTGLVQIATGSVTTNFVRFTPLSTPVALDPALIIGNIITTNLGTNGTFSIPLVAGCYGVQIGQSLRGPFNICVPDDTNTYNIIKLATNNVAFGVTNVAFNLHTILTAKGDLITFDGTNAVRLGVGTNGQSLTADSTTLTGLKYSTIAGGSGSIVGATNTGSGVGIFSQTNGNLIYLKSLVTSGFGSIATNGTNLTITFNQSGETNTASNLGAPSATVQGLFASKTLYDLAFRSLQAGTFLTFTSNANTLQIDAMQTGETNTMSFLSASNAAVKLLSSGKSGVNFPMYGVEAGTGMGLTMTSTSIVFTVNFNTNGLATIAYADLKQQGSIILTNLSGTGALTNITSANGVLISLLNASNQPVVKTVSGSGAVTVTDQVTNIQVSASAGGNVIGSTSSTDLEVPTFGGTTGQRLTNTSVIISSKTNLSVPGAVTANTVSATNGFDNSAAAAVNTFYNVVAGGGLKVTGGGATISSTLQIGSTTTFTNAPEYNWVWLGATTNVTVDWRTNFTTFLPTNTTPGGTTVVGISFANTPAAGAFGKWIVLTIYATNTGSYTVNWPTTIANQGSPPAIVPGLTNTYFIIWQGTNAIVNSWQDLTTGSGPVVLANGPLLGSFQGGTNFNLAKDAFVGSITVTNGSTNIGPSYVTGAGTFGGTVTGTNAFKLQSTLDVAGNSALSSAQVTNNIAYLYADEPIATNSTANTNLTLNPSLSTRNFFITNNISLTNWTGMGPGTNWNFQYRFTPTLVNRTVVWPALGATLGFNFLTNANSVLWTTFTNGNIYILSGSTWNTNVHLTLTAW